MLLVYYLTIINVLAFILYGIDKKKARDDKFRIPESRLILVAVLGGAIGALLGMVIFHHKTRKKKFRIVVPIFFAFYLAFIVFCLYSNYHLVTTEYEYKNSEVSTELDGYTIVQVSDLHNQLFGIKYSVLMDGIRKCDPDIIAVTGDVVDISHTNFRLAESFFEEALKIAPVYYISGNHEKWLSGYKKKRYDEFIQNIKTYGVKYIDDETLDMGGFTLVGVSDWSLGSTSVNGEDNEHINKENDGLVIMLAHEPEYIDDYSKAGADLVLSGHNHGGQIVIPGKGGLVSSDFEFFPELCNGVHEKNGTTMIISRGLGNSLFPFRVNNYPELVKVVLCSD